MALEYYPELQRFVAKHTVEGELDRRAFRDMDDEVLEELIPMIVCCTASVFLNWHPLEREEVLSNWVRRKDCDVNLYLPYVIVGALSPTSDREILMGLLEDLRAKLGNAIEMEVFEDATESIE